MDGHGPLTSVPGELWHSPTRSAVYATAASWQYGGSVQTTSGSTCRLFQTRVIHKYRHTSDRENSSHRN